MATKLLYARTSMLSLGQGHPQAQEAGPRLPAIDAAASAGLLGATNPVPEVGHLGALHDGNRALEFNGGRPQGWEERRFTAPDQAAIVDVTFWFDDPAMSDPYHRFEANPPYDFAGASGGVAIRSTRLAWPMGSM